jgi:catechol 1,2-dioxygenase
MGTTREPNERLVEVWDALVEAGRQVVRDKHVTEDELHEASRFLQELGAQKLLVGLVDTLFATAASQTQAARAGVRKANLEGPLYRPGAPLRLDGVLYDKEPSDSARFLTLRGRVFDAATGAGIGGAELDFWQSDEFGVYDDEGFNLRGVLLSDADGGYELKTIVPAPYTFHEDDLISDLFGMLGRHAYRSAHIHLKVRVGGREVLTTQFFDPGSKYLQDDVVVGAVRPDVTMEFAEVDGADTDRPGYEATFDFPLALGGIPGPVSVPSRQ